MSDETKDLGTGQNNLARDSKLGLIVAGVGTVALDAVLDGVINTLTNLDTSGWSGWWTTVAAAGIASLAGFVTAYKAKRRRVPGLYGR